MSRIVLDTNSLVQCLPSRSRYHEVWRSLADGRNTLCVSMEILNEYEEVLERLAGVDVAQLTVDTILNNSYTLLFTPYYHFDLIKADPDDNKFVDCAVVANARCIVTNDRHFDVVKRCSFPKVEIVDLVAFFKSLI